MKIDHLPNAATPPRTQADGPRGKADAAGAGTAAASPTVMHLRGNPAQAAGDVDHARVGELRQAIREGKLDIDAGRIADRLIDNLDAWMGNPS